MSKEKKPKEEKEEEKTIEHSNIHEALAAFIKEVPSIPKTKEGKDKGGNKFKYAPLDKVLSIINPVLLKHGLLLRHEITAEEGRDPAVEAILIHLNGEERIRSGPIYILNSPNAAMQGIGANITYAKRYTAELVTGITTEEDQDMTRTEHKEGEESEDRFKKAKEVIVSNKANKENLKNLIDRVNNTEEFSKKQKESLKSTIDKYLKKLEAKERDKKEKGDNKEDKEKKE